MIDLAQIETPRGRMFALTRGTHVYRILSADKSTALKTRQRALVAPPADWLDLATLERALAALRPTVTLVSDL